MFCLTCGLIITGDRPPTSFPRRPFPTSLSATPCVLFAPPFVPYGALPPLTLSHRDICGGSEGEVSKKERKKKKSSTVVEGHSAQAIARSRRETDKDGVDAGDANTGKKRKKGKGRGKDDCGAGRASEEKKIRNKKNIPAPRCRRWQR